MDLVRSLGGAIGAGDMFATCNELWLPSIFGDMRKVEFWSELLRELKYNWCCLLEPLRKTFACSSESSTKSTEALKEL